jgi:hypothetical protein
LIPFSAASSIVTQARHSAQSLQAKRSSLAIEQEQALDVTTSLYVPSKGHNTVARWEVDLRSRRPIDRQ